MRFLVFNIVVAAALVYLFTADRADIHAAADKAYGVAETVRTKAEDVVASLRDRPDQIEEVEAVASETPAIAVPSNPKPARVAANPATPDPPAAPPLPELPPTPPTIEALPPAPVVVPSCLLYTSPSPRD